MLSSIDNFLLFGANCTENCLPVKRFLGKLMSDIKRIQSSSHFIRAKGESIGVKFVFSEPPNDMKMLAFLAGELTNSATYFSRWELLAAVHPADGDLGNMLTGSEWSKQLINIRRKLKAKKFHRKQKDKMLYHSLKQKSCQEFAPCSILVLLVYPI